MKLGVFAWRKSAHSSKEGPPLMKTRYEDAISSARNNYSDHPIKPLSELEVFIGFVMTRSGVQTRRERDQSAKLADEFERIATWITAQMRRHGKDSSLPGDSCDSLDLCLACLAVGCLREKGARRRRDEHGELKSFIVVAACALLAELDMLEKESRGVSSLP